MAQPSKCFSPSKSVWTSLSIITAIVLAMPFHESQAKVFTIDNEDAIIYASNGSTNWSPDTEKKEPLLKGLSNKQFTYAYKLNGKIIYGSSNLTNSRTENFELT